MRAKAADFFNGDYFRTTRHRPPTPYPTTTEKEAHPPNANENIDPARTSSSDDSIFDSALPPTDLLPQYPNGPLNLNADGSPINFKKTHEGPNVAHWIRADAEEFERLFRTGTMRPIQFNDIPPHSVITYVNPVMSEKLNDNGSIKFRTRMTIGGDRIQYPYDKSAETADLDAVKILLNCMIS